MSAPSPPATSTTTTKVELSPEQKELYGLGMPKARAYAQSTPTIREASSVAGFDPAQIAGQQYALGISAPMTAGLSGQAGATQSMLMDPNFMLNPNQYLNAAAEAVSKKGSTDFLERIAPALRSGSLASAGPSSMGSSRRGIAEGLAAGKSSEAVSNALADMYFKNYSQGLQGLQNAVQGNQNVMAGSLMPANIMNVVGGAREAKAQQLLDEETAKYYAEQDKDLLQARQLFELAGAIPSAGSTGTVTGAMPRSNPFMQMMGLGSMLMGSGGGSGGGMGLLPMLAMK